ncbi:MAG TPA: AI-2E family transporter [Candidatus Polarisedimenticolia bacterium]|nr:AI-2E family transporter [Candidatus Polarisedimenticolia bacterium]
MAAEPDGKGSRPDDAVVTSRLLDLLLRAGLIGALAALCYVVFAPFLTLLVWAIVLAVVHYPLQEGLARRMGGRGGLAATVIVIAGVLVIVVPTALLLDSLGSSVKGLIDAVQQNTLQIPAPAESVRDWPLVGAKIHAGWSKAHSDLPALIQSMQPKIGEIARKLLAVVASIGIGVLQFVGSLIIAGILMAHGAAGARVSAAIFARLAGGARAETLQRLSVSTIRGVAQGVVGVAFIQAILIGLVLLVAGVPWAGALAMVTLVLSIAQVPALLVVIPVLVYIWAGGSYETGAAVLYTVLLLVAGLSDNVLKPLMLGRGVEAPMPVILLGALGGMASGGILGMFVGATVLALGYQIFMRWVEGQPAP